MKTLRNLVFFTVLASISASARSDVVVVVNPANANALDGSAIARIFLGKSKTFPDGSQAIPINQKEGTPVRDTFNGSVLQKSGSQLKAYWSQLVFTGKGTPPKEVDGDDEVKKLVAANPNTIGYIDAGKVDASVKVIGK